MTNSSRRIEVAGSLAAVATLVAPILGQPIEAAGFNQTAGPEFVWGDKGQLLGIRGEDGKMLSEFLEGRYYNTGAVETVDYSGKGRKALTYSYLIGDDESGGEVRDVVVAVGANGKDLRFVEIGSIEVPIDPSSDRVYSKLEKVLFLDGGEMVVVMQKDRCGDACRATTLVVKVDMEGKRTEAEVGGSYNQLIGVNAKGELVFSDYSGTVRFVEFGRLTSKGEMRVPEKAAAGFDQYRQQLVAANNDGIFKYEDNEWKKLANMPEGVAPIDWFSFGGAFKFAPNGITAFNVYAGDKWGVGVLGADGKMHALRVGESIDRTDVRVGDDGITFGVGSSRERYQSFAQGELGLMTNEIKLGKVTTGGGSLFLETAEGEKYEVVVGVQPGDKTMEHWAARVAKINAKLAKTGKSAYVVFGDGGYVKIGGEGVEDEVPVSLVDVRVEKAKVQTQGGGVVSAANSELKVKPSVNRRAE